MHHILLIEIRNSKNSHKCSYKHLLSGRPNFNMKREKGSCSHDSLERFGYRGAGLLAIHHLSANWSAMMSNTINATNKTHSSAISFLASCTLTRTTTHAHDRWLLSALAYWPQLSSSRVRCGHAVSYQQLLLACFTGGKIDILLL